MMTIRNKLNAITRHAAMAVATTAMLSGAASATSVSDDYSSFWIMGDSLSDTGNLAAATGGAFPGPAYYRNRYSNGPVWNDYFTARFRTAGKAYGNVAYAGAVSVTNTDTIPDLSAQAAIFRSVSDGFLGLRPLVAMWIGGNDIGNTAGTGTAEAAATAAVDTLVANAIALLDKTKDFLIFNLPDVGASPRFQFGDPAAAAEATAAADQYNADLLDGVALIEAAGGTVTLVDVTGLEPLLADVGVTNFTTPCLVGGVNSCSEAQADASQYWDPFHPTAVVHRLVGQSALAEFGAVPIPGAAPLLLGALGLLGWARRRV